MQHIHIIGLGLIGGSLAAALKKRHSSYSITGTSRSKDTCETALRKQYIDRIDENAAKEADIIILASPLETYRHILPELRSAPGIITDVGSAKTCVVDEMTQLLPSEQLPRCIPAHPIAGSHATGIDAADPDLFAGKEVILTPLALSNDSAITTVTDLWQACGAHVSSMDAKAHDARFAAISHLPQLLAFIGKDILIRHGWWKKAQQSSALTKHLRIMHSSPALWQGIFLANQKALSTAIETLLNQLERHQAKGDTPAPAGLETYTESASHIAQALLEAHASHISAAGTGLKDFASVAAFTAGTALLNEWKDAIKARAYQLADLKRSGSEG